jgi:hypothetical protein
LVHSSRYLLAIGADHALSVSIGVVDLTSLPDCWAYHRCPVQCDQSDSAIPIPPVESSIKEQEVLKQTSLKFF